MSYARLREIADWMKDSRAERVAAGADVAWERKLVKTAFLEAAVEHGCSVKEARRLYKRWF